MCIVAAAEVECTNSLSLTNVDITSVCVLHCGVLCLQKGSVVCNETMDCLHVYLFSMLPVYRDLLPVIWLALILVYRLSMLHKSHTSGHTHSDSFVGNS